MYKQEKKNNSNKLRMQLINIITIFLDIFRMPQLVSNKKMG